MAVTPEIKYWSEWLHQKLLEAQGEDFRRKGRLLTMKQLIHLWFEYMKYREDQ